MAVFRNPELQDERLDAHLVLEALKLRLSFATNVGAGTYMSVDAFQEQNELPHMINPRRHLVFSCAKLDWQQEDVSKIFNAGCEVAGGCEGLVHRLENSTSSSSKTVSVLVVGNSTIPSERMDAQFINPVQLVTFNAQPLLYPKTNERHLWEYVQKGRFADVTWENTNLGQLNCSVLVDSYIDHVESNPCYHDDPRQVMYTSALYYLFQDAASKTVTLSTAPDGVSSLYIGSTRLCKDCAHNLACSGQANLQNTSVRTELLAL